MYHVAPASARERIRRDGLLLSAPNPRWSKYGAIEQPAGVYVWQSLRRALQWAIDFKRLLAGHPSGRCDVWSVDLDGLEVLVDPVLGDQGARYVARPVEPARLTLLVPGSRQSPGPSLSRA